MNPKKLNILEAAIQLFADKGFYATSIQEIADKSGISKGTIYLYFSSKNELITSLFTYYHEEMQQKIKEVDDQSLPPAEKFRKKIYIYLEELFKRKEFIMLQIREQSLTVNETMIEVIQSIRYDIYESDKNMLLDLYGEAFRPYIVDGALLLESIRASVHQLLLLDHAKVTLVSLTDFVCERVDDVVQGMMGKGSSPLLEEKMFQPFDTVPDPHSSAKAVLTEMEKILETLDIPEETNNELQGAIDFLYEEIDKSSPQSFIIKGMLSNFRNIPEMKESRQNLAAYFGFSLDE